MVDTSLILFFSLLYMALLFAVAWHAEQRHGWLLNWRPVVYSLALAVYCSSWTFFGAVGQSTVNLWSYLPIYLGPMLMFLFGHRFLSKLMIAGEQQKLTSIADFIGARYGKSQLLSGIVTVCALAGSLPYIALQLRAVTLAWDAISFDAEPATGLPIDTALLAALLMCLFAILFGTRNLEGRERNRGIVTVIALESLIKLLAFAAIAWVAVKFLFAYPQLGQLISENPQWVSQGNSSNFLTQTLLASMAIFCLPRQFHMAVVEYQSAVDLKTARWVLPLYLLLFSLLILPIAVAGRALQESSGVSADVLALMLPAFNGMPGFSIIAFLGGLSAATGMVIVASVTLSVMVSNELVAPIWLRISRHGPVSVAGLGNNLKLIRRLSIMLILLLAWQFNRIMVGVENLTDFGLLAFAASTQFAPALLLGMYWKGGHRNGVIAGMLAGYLLWFYCLILPVVFPDFQLVSQGPFGLQWLRPQQLFGFGFSDALTHGVFWSLSCNTAVLLVVSRLCRFRERDSAQAKLFVDPVVRSELNLAADTANSSISVRPFRHLLQSFLGRDVLEKLWAQYEIQLGQRLLDDDLVPQFIVQDAERTLAGVVGSASSQKLIALLHRKKPLQLEDIARLVDDTSRELQFSQSILQNTVASISQGISVIDAELKLVAWNARYEQLFKYPPGLLYIGCPIDELYRINAQRGLYGSDINQIEAEVQRRLKLLKELTPHQFERKLPDGTILEVRSNPMPNGGVVTTYTDITDYRAAVVALEQSKQTLEANVQQRTEALLAANQALQQENARRAQAEQQLRDLHAAKTRFLAYTSHDLMQPINAARLFVGTMQQNLQEPTGLVEDLGHITKALDNAEELVDALREISRLDGGNLVPQPEHFSIDELIAPLLVEMQFHTSKRPLQLRYVPSALVVISDRHLLRRILQNFLSNALLYTQRGKVLLGCRRRGSEVEIQLWDTGPGIEEEKLASIFEEFVRLGLPENMPGKGLGLGLAIARRSADLLGHVIRVKSVAGRGSMFSLTVPQGSRDEIKPVLNELIQSEAQDKLKVLKVLCVDNNPSVLAGMRQFLQEQAGVVDTAASTQEACALMRQAGTYNVLLLDYHLNDAENGIDCMLALQQLCKVQPQVILISADTSEAVRSLARTHNSSFLAKPVKPAALLNMLRKLARELA